MAVTVVTKRYSNGNEASSETFSEADGFAISESGHLTVHHAAGERFTTSLGAFAPGNWISVYKDESKTFNDV
jgi:hypothetical protein